MKIEPKTGGPAFPTHGGHHPDDDPRNHTLGGGIRSSASYKPTTERRRRRHLTKEDVADIRGRIAAGESHSSIAAKLGVSIATVSNVRNGRTDYGR